MAIRGHDQGKGERILYYGELTKGLRVMETRFLKFKLNPRLVRAITGGCKGNIIHILLI